MMFWSESLNNSPSFSNNNNISEINKAHADYCYRIGAGLYLEDFVKKTNISLGFDVKPHKVTDKGIDFTANMGNMFTLNGECLNWYGGYIHPARWNSIVRKLSGNADINILFAFGVKPTLAQYAEAKANNIYIIHYPRQLGITKHKFDDDRVSMKNWLKREISNVISIGGVITVDTLYTKQSCNDTSSYSSCPSSSCSTGFKSVFSGFIGKFRLLLSGFKGKYQDFMDKSIVNRFKSKWNYLVKLAVMTEDEFTNTVGKFDSFHEWTHPKQAWIRFQNKYLAKQKAKAREVESGKLYGRGKDRVDNYLLTLSEEQGKAVDLAPSVLSQIIDMAMNKSGCLKCGKSGNRDKFASLVYCDTCLISDLIKDVDSLGMLKDVARVKKGQDYVR
jgi:hypothetical protein